MIKIAQEKIAQERATGDAAIANLNQEMNSLNQRKLELNQQIQSEQKEIKQIELQLKSTIITAPVNGTILKLNLRNTAQSVKSGEELVQIAPNHSPLIIKAKVVTQDRAKIQLKQLAQMRVAAYPYPDYGLLEGTVMAISPDTIEVEKNSTTPQKVYYQVTIEPEKLYLKNNSENQIKSGMEVTTDIIVKEETILKFILRKTRLLADI